MMLGTSTLDCHRLKSQKHLKDKTFSESYVEATNKAFKQKMELPLLTSNFQMQRPCYFQEGSPNTSDIKMA